MILSFFVILCYYSCCHPNFGDYYDYDYGMVHTRDIDLISWPTIIAPIRIPDPTYEELPDGTPVIESGWGLMGRNGNGEPVNIAQELQYGVYEAMRTAECQKYWGNGYVQGGHQQCAIDPSARKASTETVIRQKPTPRAVSCAGDSGGPLIVVINGEKRLQGNTSWGHGNCDPTYPACWSRNADPGVNAWIKSTAGLTY